MFLISFATIKSLVNIDVSGVEKKISTKEIITEINMPIINICRIALERIVNLRAPAKWLVTIQNPLVMP